MLTDMSLSYYLAAAISYVHKYWEQLFYIVVGLVLWSLIKRRFVRRRKRTKVRWRVNSSKKLLRYVQSLEQPGVIFAHLRNRDRVDPFLFEELLLTAFAENGHRIKRNKRYTGDGGIDGRVKVDGTWHLIQAKRYQNAIRPSDVKGFSGICSKLNMPGLFIHTGRTGPLSKELAHACPHVTVISGQRLIHLLRPTAPESSRRRPHGLRPLTPPGIRFRTTAVHRLHLS